MRVPISPLEIARKLEAHAAWLDTGGQSGQPADFSFVDLEGIRWPGVRLSRALFIGAFLKNAMLQDADLREAKFLDAFLVEANLAGADLRGACFRGAHLEEANLRHTNLHTANLDGTRLHGADLREAQGVSRKQLSLAVVADDTRLPRNVK